MTGPNVTCRTRKFKFEEISYVKRITRKELKVALRDFYLDDLEEHEYEGDDKECVDEEADFVADSYETDGWSHTHFDLRVLSGTMQ